MPTVDRDRGDVRDILGVVVNKTDNDQYKRAVKGGLINGHYLINQFDLCPYLVGMNDVCVVLELHNFQLELRPDLRQKLHDTLIPHYFPFKC